MPHLRAHRLHSRPRRTRRERDPRSRSYRWSLHQEPSPTEWVSSEPDPLTRSCPATPPTSTSPGPKASSTPRGSIPSSRWRCSRAVRRCCAASMRRRTSSATSLPIAIRPRRRSKRSPTAIASRHARWSFGSALATAASGCMRPRSSGCLRSRPAGRRPPARSSISPHRSPSSASGRATSIPTSPTSSITPPSSADASVHRHRPAPGSPVWPRPAPCRTRSS